MSRLKQFTLIAIALVTVSFLFVMLLLPSLVRNTAVEAVSKKYGRTLVIKKLSINPFTWTVEARGITLSEKRSSAVFFACSSVRTTISPASVYHRAPVLSSIGIVSPYLHLIRKNAVSYNFSDFIPSPGSKPDKKPAKFSLNNIWLKDGVIEITDQLVLREQRQLVQKLEVRIPFLSNLPYLADSYITPGMSAVVNGARFSLEGKLKPFARHVEVMVEVKLGDLDLPHYASYLPATIPVRLASGKLTTDLQIIHRAVASGEPAMVVSGIAQITNLELKDRGESPLLSLDNGTIRIRQGRILAGVYDIDAIELGGPALHLSRDRQGIFNLLRLTTPTVERAHSPAGQEKLKEPVTGGANRRRSDSTVVNIGKIALNDGKFHFTDQFPPGGFAVELDAIALKVSDFSTLTNKSANYTLTFTSNRKEQFDLSGTFSAKPAATATKAVFSGLELGALHPYLTPFLTAPVAGTLDVSALLTFTPEAGANVTDLALTLKKLDVRFGEHDGARVPEIALKGGAIDLKGRQATVASVAAKGGSLVVSRTADGKLSPLSLLRPLPVKSQAPPASPSAPPFRYGVKSVKITGLELGFTDYQNSAAPSFRLTRSTFSLANLAGPGSSRMPFTFSAGFGGGSLASAGTLGIDPLQFAGSCTLKDIPITAFDAYFPPELHLIIADGIMDTNLSLSLASTPGVAGTFKGDVTVKRFHSLDDVEGEDLLKWENLHLGGLNGTLNPFSLNLAQVSLSDYFARVTIEKDATLNLQKLYGTAPPPAVATPLAVQKQPPPASPASPRPPAGKIAIDAVTLQGGTIIFSDHHIKPEFSATMYKLGGRINGLSSEQMKYADLELRGNLLNQSPLGITGKINPLRGDLFVDMKVSFDDIELSPLTPYSGTYLGYTVDKGKLFLDLLYHIENRELTSQNRVFIDQFTLGDKVASDRATKLPVRLAIALLKDGKGEIHLDLPVTGRTDDPKFSVWKVIGQILMNLVEKAATAPFKLLGALFGGGENFSAVQFSPGSAELDSGGRQKLVRLGKLLADRPSLNLEVRGYVDREHDPEGYRSELLRKKMKNEKFLAMVKEKKNLPGQTAEEMVIGSEETSRWLKAVYGKEKFPKPRNVIGLVKELPDAEMQKLIYTSTIVGDEELAQLARARVMAVKEYLVSGGGVQRERVFEKSGPLTENPGEAGIPASRVEFGLAAK